MDGRCARGGIGVLGQGGLSVRGDLFGNHSVALVIPMILEAFGGDLTSLSLLHPRRLALRAKGARARDSTVYGGSSTSAKSFFVHHTQQLAAAAQVGDAKGIRKKITEMKMRLIKVALKATGRG